MGKNQKEINELDIMKVITTMLVIIGHICRIYSPDSIINPYSE